MRVGTGLLKCALHRQGGRAAHRRAHHLVAELPHAGDVARVGDVALGIAVDEQQVGAESPLDRRPTGTGAAGMASASSSCSIPSAMSRSRRRGSFSRHRRTSRRRAGGTFSGNASHDGSALITAARTSDASSPSNARRPANISNNTEPNARISARRSTGRPFACSGTCRRQCRGSRPSRWPGNVNVGEFVMSTCGCSCPPVPAPSTGRNRGSSRGRRRAP